MFPWIGREPVAAITPVKLLEVLRRIEARGVIETAHRALENCGQVFRYAVATGHAVSNPARDLKDALREPMVKHFSAITDPNRLGELLRACDNYQGTHVVRAALRLAPLLLLRPGELRHARWEEFDLDATLWLVPAARMKQGKAAKVHGKPHAVSLPTQAVQTLRELHAVTGGGEYAPGQCCSWRRGNRWAWRSALSRGIEHAPRCQRATCPTKALPAATPANGVAAPRHAFSGKPALTPARPVDR